MSVSSLKAGQLVEVRSKEEILATLDSNGCLDGLPFMPEMFKYCGQRLPVYKRAHKTCDTVFPIRARKMTSAVHLETRCDGSAHGGCQAACLLFWKEAWLKPLASDSLEPGASLSEQHSASGRQRKGGCTENDVRNAARVEDNEKGEPTYVCQATRLPYATGDLNWWEIHQYFEDYRSGNVGISRILCGLIYKTCFHLSHTRGTGRLTRWLWNHLPALWRGTPWPFRKGLIPRDQRTPSQDLNLQAGELVRIKPYEEILRTLNSKNLNRGMYFDKEMVPYCDGEYRVLKRVNKIINEQTGKMQEMKTPCIILDKVVCQSRYSECRLFCPRSIYSYWREIWLERVNESTNGVGQQAS